MTFKTASALAPLAFLFLSASARAEVLQTWRLESTTYQVQGGFTPPAFLELGKDFYIDYVIDVDTPASPGWNNMFTGAVKSFSVNGITSESQGYIMALGGLNAINLWPSQIRSDGIDFISFNNFLGAQVPDVSSALQGFASSAGTWAGDLRLDFGNKSVWARPSSFVMTSVPEPMSGLLMLIGLPLLLSSKYGRRSKR